MMYRFLFPAMLLISAYGQAQDLTSASFSVSLDQNGITRLENPKDTFPTNYIEKGKHLGPFMVRYRIGETGPWRVQSSGDETGDKSGTTGARDETGDKSGAPAAAGASSPLACQTTFTLADNGAALDYHLQIQNKGAQPIHIGDLGIPFYYNKLSGENPKQIFEERVLKHSFVSGNGSFMFWERPTGVGPYLVMVPLPGTHLEYYDLQRADSNERVYTAYIHAKATGKNWRQPLTELTIPAGGSISYGFRFRWAGNYQGVRDILYRENLPDIQVVPGMTVPNDLYALFSVHSRLKIDSITGEFPKETTISYEGQKGKDTYLYKVRLNRLGENRLTISYGIDHKTYLEFFSTEPLSTLYKKRAAFLASHQQHRDSTKWYDGVFSPWDMRNQVLRGPDNTDGFDGWWGYVLTCDDPGLCKAPFLAAKNLHYPNQREIDALEYYIKNFVWGKLQRTDKETPYPYGVYGTPNWYVDRDPEKRKQVSNQNLDKEHVWRSYDYPHIMMLYFHMYQIASLYPGMTHYLDSKGYLIRAMKTARAFFTYPYEILPWYETYKWGCYNELLLIDLMAALRKEGYDKDAEWLRGEWEKKVKYFVYDDPYPYRSEYSVDATAFESSHAFARYAVEHAMQPDTNLWYDKNLHRWYSHPVIAPEDGRRFMEKQIQANIACRGWLENAYYLKGSDFRGSSDKYLLSYMAAMGGWAVMDYALHFSANPNEYLPLGYASYLSSFALMNTGTAQSNYGFWYPGKENDGASGWAFEPMAHTTTWIRKEQDRGAWFYDGEIDLGYGGALRTASTVLTRDPVFGLFAYGGLVAFKDGVYKVTPRDGVQQRFYYVVDTARCSVLLNRDGFGAISMNDALDGLLLEMENRTGDKHQTVFTLTGFQPGRYTVFVNGRQAAGTIIAGQAATDIAVDVPEGKAYQVRLTKGQPVAKKVNAEPGRKKAAGRTKI